MTFARTVLGDVDPADLGVTYAHEHLVIDQGRPVELNPDFLLIDLDLMSREVDEARALGLRTVVDAMPADAGRSVEKLAKLSRRTGLRIIAPTGLHHERFYGPGHWSLRLSVAEIAALFVADIADGVDANDYSGPVVRRSSSRAGVIKIAGSDGGPSARDRRIFEAAAQAHLVTGAPILTHCEGGTGALEQVRTLSDFGVAPERVALSHVDKVVDVAYHAEIRATGAFVEYDQAHRWGDDPNGTLTLLEAAAEDSRLDGILLGMDAARQGYYHAFGGQPGLGFLLGEFSRAMTERGLGDGVQERLLVDNPARWLTFAGAGTA